MSETCKWTNDEERYQLALTMVQLSAGWQMRDPLDMRRFEIQKALAERFKSTQLTTPAVFALESNVIHGESRSTRPPSQRLGFPPDVDLAIEALSSVQGTIDTMLDAQPIPVTPTPAWVARFQGFTDWLSGQKLGPEKKRQSIDLFFLQDSLKEIAEAVALTGISGDERRAWIQVHSNSDIKAMPAMGLFREVLHQKHLNPGTRWEDNDLTDVMYLTCAAAYADYAVGENSLVSQVEQALKRLGKPLNVYRRLRDLVPALDGL